jgi:small-conductance mechanosensitive channel
MDDLSLPTLWEQLRLRATLLLVRCGTGLLILAAFWATGRSIQRLIVRLFQGRPVDPDLVCVLARSAKITLVVIGAVTALGTLGVDVTALVAGLGLAGFALGFALKDMISNALAGILILLYKPFHRGDRVTVDTHEGEVVEINLRYTVLGTEDARILIPNANLFTTIVKVAAPGSTASKEEPAPAGPPPAEPPPPPER